MEANGIVIPEPEKPDVFIAVLGDRALNFALSLLKDLREKGFRAELDLMGRNLKGQFKYADRINAAYTILVGDDELDAGKVSLRDMATSTQTLITTDEIIQHLKK